MMMISPEHLPEPGTVPRQIDRFESEISLVMGKGLGSLGSVFDGGESSGGGLGPASVASVGDHGAEVVAEAARGKNFGFNSGLFRKLTLFCGSAWF